MNFIKLLKHVPWGIKWRVINYYLRFFGTFSFGSINVNIEDAVSLGPDCKLLGDIYLGAGTKINSNVEFIGNISIGRYCSIARHVIFQGRNHFFHKAAIQEKFYIEDEGVFTNENNLYLTVLSLNTYEAPEGDGEMSDRIYLKSFDIKSTRYIMGELRFINLVPHEWYCELFFNIYDDTGMLIGNSDSFRIITPEAGTGEDFTISAGWGLGDPGIWVEDNYTMEVVFMDTVIAVIPFSIGNAEVRRVSEYEALLNEDVLGFDNTAHDFEMLVLENGHETDTSTTTYFFYVELE